MEEGTSSANSPTDANPAYITTPKLVKELETLFQGTNLSSTVKQHGLLEFPVKDLKFDKIV